MCRTASRRGLNGIVGWVPSTQVVVDGEAPPQTVAASASTGTAGVVTPQMGAASASASAPTVPGTPGPGQVPGATTERGKVGNTDGVGVVLRNSPRDADRSRTGLMDGAGVSVVERSGSDWVHVHAENGQEGWVPARYVVPAP